MPDETTEKIYYDPISVAQRTPQKLHLVNSSDKREILLHLVKNIDAVHAVVITKTKREADALSVYLNTQEIKSVSVHGSKRAEQNETSVQAFNAADVAVLISTDIILQSLQLSNVSHLISYDIPTEPDYYLHRMACLKEQGQAIAFVSEDQESALLDIERVMRHEIEEEEIVGFVPTPESERTPQATSEKKKKPRHRKKKRKAASTTDTSKS